MSGFEVAGVVLGAIPIIVSAVEGYGKLLDGYSRTKNSAILVNRLARHLRDEQVAFEETCTTLLGQNVPLEKVKSLLQDPTGRPWQDEHVQRAIALRFDCNNEEVFRDTVQDINDAIAELRAKLCLGPDGKVRVNPCAISKPQRLISKTQDNSLLLKTKRIKFALEVAKNFPQYEATVKEIKGYNKKLDRLLRNSRDNEHIRRYSSKRDVLDLLQGVTSSLFRALRFSISCSCAHLHGFNFQLPILQITTQPRVNEAIKKNGFRITIVNNSGAQVDDTSANVSTPAWLWKEVLLKWMPGMQGDAKTINSSPAIPAPEPQVPKNNKPSKGVKFSDDPLNISSVVKSQWRSFRGSSSSSSMPSLQVHTTTGSSSAIVNISPIPSIRATSTATCQASSLSVSSAASLQSAPTLIQSAPSMPSSRTPSPVVAVSKSHSETNLAGPASIEPLNLCHRFATDTDANDLCAEQVFGIVTDRAFKSPRNFEVICLKSGSSTSTPVSSSPMTTVSLRTVLMNRRKFFRGRPPLLSVRQKLASTVAASVLTLHATPWMPPLLTSNDLLFVQRDGKPLLDRVFISKRPVENEDKERSTAADDFNKISNGNKDGSAEDDDVIDGIDTLLVLGVLLVEIGLWKPVWEFWEGEKECDISQTDKEELKKLWPNTFSDRGINNNTSPPSSGQINDNMNGGGHSHRRTGTDSDHYASEVLLPHLCDLLDTATGPGYDRAMSLLKRIKPMGKQYYEATQTCIMSMVMLGAGGWGQSENDNNNNNNNIGEGDQQSGSTSLDNPSFRDAVYSGVVAPLQQATQMAHDVMVIGDKAFE